MRVEAGGVTYATHFWVEPVGWVGKDRGRITSARVHAGSCDRGTAGECRAGVVAFAYCNPKDTFRKETGRRVALGRALMSLVPDKTARQEFWIDYLRQKGLFIVIVDPATGLPPGTVFGERP